MSVPIPNIHRVITLGLVLVSALGSALVLREPVLGAGDHLVISEVVTGGASASDELIEIHNPTSASLPLAGLELIYVSATGATVSRRATWDLAAPDVQPGGHVLVANEAGIYVAIADATYASGMAATGGSVALRIQGASTAIDAVGWGTATSSWREGVVAVAPATGASLERLPGGAQGSGRDTDDNAADFVERSVPDPQNLASPVTPGPADPPTGPTPEPTPQATPDVPAPNPTPSPEAPGQPVVPIGTARSLLDGTLVTIEGVALTGSDFHDGGGFVADATGGVAVLVDGGAFSRGAQLRVTGTIGDRFSQRTLRAGVADVQVLGGGVEPEPRAATTLTVAEAVEGNLVRVAATIVGGRSELATGVAFDIDDGSGPTRLLFPAGSGIDAATWATGTSLTLRGIVGQRDSSGTGTSGYRLMPRDAADIIAVGAPSPTPAPTASAGPSGQPGESPGPDGTVTIAAAREAARNAALVVRGVVTLPPGIVDADTAVIQDETGAIVLRLSDGVGTLRLGDRVEVAGTRSTKSGLETLRVTQPAVVLGRATLPHPPVLHTGEVGEAHEALFVTVRGALAANARRSSTGSVSVEIDDGSGGLKVAMGPTIAVDPTALTKGTWIEVTGVLGQVTTGSAPTSGYRIWPATRAAVRVTAPGGGSGADGSGGSGSPNDGSGAGPAGGLTDVGMPGLDGLRIGATLVAGPWPELGVGGLLWDGVRLVAVDAASADLVEALLGDIRPPLALDLGGLEVTGAEPLTGIGRVALGTAPGDTLPAGLPAAPTARPGAAPAWASMIGLVLGSRDRPVLIVPAGLFRIEVRCSGEQPRRGLLSVTGVALDRPDRLIVGCGGMRPVPMLGRAGFAAAPIGPTPSEAPPPNATATSPEAPTRPLAAGLLAVAALGAAAAAALARLRGDGPGPDGDAPASEQEVREESTDDAGPTRLALVSLPRERGP